MARQLASITAIDVDPELWNWVHHIVPGEGRQLQKRRESPVYPVFERDGRLVLLSNFASFVEARAAGVPVVDVWVAYFDPTFTEMELAEDYSTGLGDDPV